MEKHILSITVEDKPGVLTRVSSLFSRRGYNIQSLTVANTHQKGISRFTITLAGDYATLEQIKKQCQKLIHVITVETLNPKNSILREFSVLKLKYGEESTEKINHVIDFYGARLLDITDETLTIEISGSEEKVDRFLDELKKVEIIESIRTGKIGMIRGKIKTQKENLGTK